MKKQITTEDEPAAARPTHHQATSGFRHGFSRDDIESRRAQMRAWIEARRENMTRYRATRNMWNNPWAEARRQQHRAYRDQMQKWSSQRYSQLQKEREHLMEQEPYASGPGEWGPSGPVPFGPMGGPRWGAYPRY
ncbi:MAG: hypothetical protein GY731_03155 [Gammaproteobacteria bacterium]|nr:hypothetical protein [Gammaproteobacteria bacterium]